VYRRFSRYVPIWSWLKSLTRARAASSLRCLDHTRDTAVGNDLNSQSTANIVMKHYGLNRQSTADIVMKQLRREQAVHCRHCYETVTAWTSSLLQTLLWNIYGLNKQSIADIAMRQLRREQAVQDGLLLQSKRLHSCWIFKQNSSSQVRMFTKL
jgi:hypothetical protein